MRKLASIQKIEEIKTIEGADAIEAYRVLGWWIVDKKGVHRVGDLVVYCEIDSWVPTELAPFLSKGKEPKEYEGVRGERLRTIRLRGQLSQGLILPLEILMKEGVSIVLKGEDLGGLEFGEDSITIEEGEDVTGWLGIKKWEAPIPAQLQGQAEGMFPTSLIPKTDQERIQNCFGEIQKRAKRFLVEKFWDENEKVLKERPVVVPEDFQEPTYEVTLKLDGSSCTIFRWEGKLRVCSRNLELKINEENADNAFVKMALKYGHLIDDGFALQGEIMGPNIQGNREGFKEVEFYVFDVYDIFRQEYFKSADRLNLVNSIGMKHVPVIAMAWEAPNSVTEGLELAEGPSINHPIREGLVWKDRKDPDFSFKTISNKFLLKGGD